MGRCQRDRQASLSAPRVATRWEESLSERVPGEALFEEDAAKIRMPVELDAEHVVRFPLAPVRALPYRGERRNMRVELGARGPQHDRDPRARTANEGYRAELSTGVDSGIHGIQIASSARVVANERRDFHESIALH